MIFSDNFTFEGFKQLVLSFYPSKSLLGIVSNTQQSKIINDLKAIQDKRHFYFVVDVTDFEIKQLYNVNKWLGYSESEFNMQQYLSIYNESNKRSMLMIAAALYENLCHGKMALDLSLRYTSLVAMQHYNGQYYLAIKECMPFQYDKNNRLMAHLDHFIIIGKFLGQPLDPNFYNVNMGNEEERGKAILAKTRQYFLDNKVFSSNEYSVALALAKLNVEDSKKIADHILQTENKKIKTNDINKYKKRLLAKCNALLYSEIKYPLAAVDYLKGIGIL